MLFIFIVWRIPISPCRTSLQPPLHTAVYSQLRLPWLIYFLSSLNRVQCEAYHKHCSVMCLQPQQCQQIGFRGQAISWEEALLAPHREKERTLRRQEKIMYDWNIRPHHFSLLQVIILTLCVTCTSEKLMSEMDFLGMRPIKNMLNVKRFFLKNLEPPPTPQLLWRGQSIFCCFSVCNLHQPLTVL